MRHESSRVLFDYWNEIRGSRNAPERSEVEPAEIRQILGDTFILEVSHQMRTIAYRLAGTRLCAAYGRELKGVGYLAHWREEDNYEIARGIHRVYNKYNPVLLAFSAQSESGRFVEYEGLLLPLKPAMDGNARILGVSSPRRAPYWLGADPIACNLLRTLRPLDLGVMAPNITTDESPDENLPNSDETPRKKGHLLVFEGGRNEK